MIFGSWFGKVVAIGAMLSCFSSTVGWVLLQAQIPLAAAKDGLFPHFFSRVSKRNTPVPGLILSGVIISLLIAMNYNAQLVNQFTNMVNYCVLAFLLTYFYSMISQLVLFSKHSEKFHKGSLVRSVIICLLGFAYAFWMILGSGSEMVFYGSILLFGCAPIYGWVCWHNRKKQVSQ